MSFRNTIEVISDIKLLVKEKGYLYAILLILIDDFHYDVERMSEVNAMERLSKNEVMMLLGFLIQSDLSKDAPESPEQLLDLKQKTYELMQELHFSTMNPFIEKMKPVIENPKSDHDSNKKDFFGDKDMFVEPIFYAGDGIYDFQYVEFLERKYKYDESWLNVNKKFNSGKAKATAFQIKAIHQEKTKRINFGLKEKKPELLKKIKRDKTVPKERGNELITMMEFYQFEELFETQKHASSGLNPIQISEYGWKSFYSGLLDIFTIHKADFSGDLEIATFLELFSIPRRAVNRNYPFQSIGDFNVLSANPIIPIDEDSFLVPISFSVFEAIYESPYYWMLNDKSYATQLASHRGKAGEEIAHELLEKVFGRRRSFKSVKVQSKKGQDETDIDVLCFLGSKAICVQVKSKKLTQLSRKGNAEQLKKDFKGAVHDAYQQGLISRDRIITKGAIFLDENGNEINVDADIDEAYILIVTTENYPSLTHQSRILLDKEQSDPHPLVLTIFDLELILFYLNNPYDFLYYIRQRTTLMEYFHADEEAVYLGYHLTHKLWKIPKSSYVGLQSDFAALIDQNYYPYKLGIDIPAEKDKIKARWRNQDFEKLCNQIAELDSPKVTDVIFYLLDYSEQSRTNLVDQIKVARSKTQADHGTHNFSLMTGPERTNFGITFISWSNNSISELRERLISHATVRKYKSKARTWVGIACLKDTGRLVDSAVLIDDPWQYDESMEKLSELMFEGLNKGQPISFGKKVGRNDYCPCGSGDKYKKCCGR